MKTTSLAVALALILGVSLCDAGPARDVANQAEELLKQGSLQAAETVIDSALAVYPDDPDLLGVKAQVLFQQKDFIKALEYFNRILAQDQKNPQALYGAGMSALELEETQQALDYFERGTKTRKLKGDFLYGTALTQMKMGDLASADATIRKAINTDEENPTYHRALGDINYEKQVWSIAIGQYRQAIELDSTLTGLYYRLARASLNSRNVNDAVDYYRRYLKATSDDTTAWRELGLIYEKSNNPAEAIFCYKKITELAPNDGNSWFALGMLQFGVNSYEEAGSSLEKAVALGAHVADAYKTLAKVYQNREEYYKADTAYTLYEQQAGAPDSAEYWFEKGKVMLKIGQKEAAFYDRAVQAFDRTIQLDSTNASYWEYAGLARYYKNDFAGAIPFFKERIELGGETVNAYRNLAICYLKTEKYDLAAKALEDALALKPDDAVMHSMVGKIYTVTGNYDGAIRHLTAALQNSGADNSNSLSAEDKCKINGDLGYCYVVQRDAQKAISYLETAVGCDPRNTDYLFNLASAYHLDNQLKEANKYYKEVLALDPNHQGAKEGAARTTPRQ